MVRQLADHPVVLVFVVLAVGSLVGAINVKGVSLGPAGALFAGLALSAMDARLALPDVVGNVGLALFTYTLGLASGPSFSLCAGRRHPNADDQWRSAPLLTVTIEVQHAGMVLGDVADRIAGGAAFSRLLRDGAQSVPGQQTVLAVGDRLSITGPRDTVDAAAALLGVPVDERITDDRSQLDVRRIVLSNRQLGGRVLGELDLYRRFGAVATRVRRGDVDLLADDSFVLVAGDRVRVVAPPDQMRAIAELLGDSERRVGEVDSLGFTAGLAISLLVGLVSIPLPGGGTFALGGAGGPLLVGLLLGRLERTGPLVWQPPYGANLALRQLGTILFLGTVGSRSGSQFIHALRSLEGLRLVVSSLVVVSVSATVLIGAGRRVARLGSARLAGLIAGAETQPAVLAFASERSDDERVSITYALTFPGGDDRQDRAGASDRPPVSTWTSGTVTHTGCRDRPGRPH